MISKINRIFILLLLLIFSIHSGISQSLLDSIKIALDNNFTKESTSYDNFSLGVKKFKSLKSKNGRFILFSCSITDSTNIEKPSYTEKIFIFDKNLNQINELELGHISGLVNPKFSFYSIHFAKFYEHKFVFAYSQLGISKVKVCEFSLDGKKLEAYTIRIPKEGAFINQKSDLIIKVQGTRIHKDGAIMYVHNLNTGEKIKIAKVFITGIDAGDGHLCGIPNLTLDSNNRVIITNFRMPGNKERLKDQLKKEYIEPLINYELVDNKLIFEF